MIAMRKHNNRSAAPNELVRHIPFYRILNAVFLAVTVSSSWIIAIMPWEYPIFGILSLVAMSVGIIGLLVGWFVKPVATRMTAKVNHIWYAEEAFVVWATGTVLSKHELRDRKADDLVRWHDATSSFTMAFGLLSLIGIVLGAAAAGCFTYPA